MDKRAHRRTIPESFVHLRYNYLHARYRPAGAAGPATAPGKSRLPRRLSD